VVEYSQGWLSRAVDPADNKQAAWRADPAQAGVGGCVADIGVHAFHLAELVSGLRVLSLCARLSGLVPGRVLDDDANLLLTFEGGAVGVIVTSQAASGDRNDLRLRVHGDRASLAWSHEAPQILTIDSPDGPGQVLHAAAPYLTPAGRAASRLPTGHPEGFIEAFANLYRDFAAAIRGEPAGPGAGAPDIEAGVRGMAFIEAAVRSSGAGWVTFEGAA
jgi:predicted dehydrogenase